MRVLACSGRRALPGPVQQEAREQDYRRFQRGQCPLVTRPLVFCLMIYIVQYDPITPLASAEEVARQLGEDAVLVKQNGFGVRFFLLSCYTSITYSWSRDIGSTRQSLSHRRA